MARITVNHPFIAVVEGINSMQFFLVVERVVTSSTSCFLDAMWGMMSLYFTFDISYPKPLQSLLIFVQHLVMSFIDKQKVPPAATRVYSSLQTLPEDELV